MSLNNDQLSYRGALQNEKKYEKNKNKTKQKQTKQERTEQIKTNFIIQYFFLITLPVLYLYKNRSTIKLTVSPIDPGRRTDIILLRLYPNTASLQHSKRFILYNLFCF